MTDTLVQAMLNPSLYDHPVSGIQLIETHISWVILTGDYAYKIKKPVDLHFLDFSTLDKRRFYCNEEIRLNQRLAPAIYLDVTRITGCPEQPQLNGSGKTIEYAVKMLQFPQQAQLDRMLQRGELENVHIDAIAAKAAAFHNSILKISEDSPFGDPQQVLVPVYENFSQIRDGGCDTDASRILDRLSAWIDEILDKIEPKLLIRKASGFVRECHGDMHLRNIAYYNDEIIIFDCIEFNENLRCIDVMSEIAFMVMDLDDRGRSDLASRFLNRYLESTGDYAGLCVLRFYLVYRALVRAKVDCIRAGQDDINEAEKSVTLLEFQNYLALAERYITPPEPILMVMLGLSGSGKTYISDSLLELIPAIRLRSDIERKRLHGYEQQERTASGIDTGVYSESATHKTYEHLQQQARILLENLYPVIIDAAFLHAWQRKLFFDLSRETGATFIIIECAAPDKMLRQRLKTRAEKEHDASEADIRVLEHQLVSNEPLYNDEARYRLLIHTENPVDMADIVNSIRGMTKTA